MVNNYLPVTPNLVFLSGNINEFVHNLY